MGLVSAQKHSGPWGNVFTCCRVALLHVSVRCKPSCWVFFSLLLILNKWVCDSTSSSLSHRVWRRRGARCYDTFGVASTPKSGSQVTFLHVSQGRNARWRWILKKCKNTAEWSHGVWGQTCKLRKTGRRAQTSYYHLPLTEKDSGGASACLSTGCVLLLGFHLQHLKFWSKSHDFRKCKEKIDS